MWIILNTLPQNLTSKESLLIKTSVQKFLQDLCQSFCILHFSFFTGTRLSFMFSVFVFPVTIRHYIIGLGNCHIHWSHKCKYCCQCKYGKSHGCIVHLQQTTSSLNLRIVQDCTKWILCIANLDNSYMAESVIRQSILHDVAHFGVRSTIGVIFVMHSLESLILGSQGFLQSRDYLQRCRFQ